MREGFPYGEFPLRIEQTEFRFRDYLSFLESIRGEAQIARTRQQEAFAAERARWEAAGQNLPPSSDEDSANTSPLGSGIPEGCISVAAPMTASVWKILVELVSGVAAGDLVVILEAMKTEVAIKSPVAGVVEAIRTRTDALVMNGQDLIVLRTGLTITMDNFRLDLTALQSAYASGNPRLL